MLFNSFEFILFFLVVAIGYYLLGGANYALEMAGY